MNQCSVLQDVQMAQSPSDCDDKGWERYHWPGARPYVCIVGRSYECKWSLIGMKKCGDQMEGYTLRSGGRADLSVLAMHLHGTCGQGYHLAESAIVHCHSVYFYKVRLMN